MLVNSRMEGLGEGERGGVGGGGEGVGREKGREREGERGRMKGGGRGKRETGELGGQQNSKAGGGQVAPVPLAIGQCASGEYQFKLITHCSLCAAPRRARAVGVVGRHAPFCAGNADPVAGVGVAANYWHCRAKAVPRPWRPKYT